ncbi:MAG TPA: hypothetical protein VEL74_16375 [Thermoanaerobaculia bacterium]|nr:hypothetical protein [Thermoanaerobaculia bacterium]
MATPSARRLAVAVLALGLLAALPAAACTSCYGAADAGAPLISGARLGVFLLLGITLAVLAGFVRFFLYLRKRARQAGHDGVEQAA